jgi:two-component system cell cycle response regulator DivK
MNHCILVVEDDPASRELMYAWLEAEGFRVLCASDVQSAIDLLSRENPDAVLLDVRLGDEDGLVIAAHIQRHAELRHVPVIAVTAHAMVTEQHRILSAGCRACLSKPVNFAQLRENLLACLSGGPQTA